MTDEEVRVANGRVSDCLRWVAKEASLVKGRMPRGLRLKEALKALDTAYYEMDLDGGPEKVCTALEWVARQAHAARMAGLTPAGGRLREALDMLKQRYAALPKS